MDDFFKKKNCDRCGKPLTSRTMSMFNTDVICPECKEKAISTYGLGTEQDPRYQKAREAELNAIRHGNFNFKGIGY